MIRTWKMLALTGALLLAIAGCGGASQQGEQGEQTGGNQQGQQGGQTQQVVQGDEADLALVTINLEALFFTQMVEGAREAAQDANASLSVFNANDDPAAQNRAIENYIQQGVDGIMVVAIDTEGIRPAIQSAEEADIPVAAIDAIVDSPAVDVQIGVNNREAAQDLGDFFNDWAAEQGLDSARTGVVSALNSTIQIERQDGFTNTIEDAGHEIAQVVDGKNQQAEAQRAAETLFTANPNLDATYATGEPALIGLVAAARSQGMTEQVSLFGWDLSQQAIDGIDDGFVVAVVQQDPKTEGTRAVESLMSLLNNEEVPNNISIPTTIVTQENVDDFRSIFE